MAALMHVALGGYDARTMQLRKVAADNRALVVSGKVSIPLTMSLTFTSLAAAPLPGKWRDATNEPARLLLWSVTTDLAIRKCCASPREFGCVDALNFANSLQAGGDYLGGAPTQEESLCRCCVALYPSLARSKYSFAYDKELKYTPDIAVLRDTTREEQPLLPSQEIAQCNIITAAAPDLRWPLTRWNEAVVERILDAVYRVPLLCRATTPPAGTLTLIVGAFGNGVFANKPSDTAAVFRRVNERYRAYYRNIIFAIPDEGSINYRTFKSVLQL